MVKGVMYSARAGAGKTTFITKKLVDKFKNKKVLFLTYTNQNANNLSKQLLDSRINFRFYQVDTIFRFLNSNFIKPFKNSIEEDYKLDYPIKEIYFRSNEDISKAKHEKISRISSLFWQNSAGRIYGDKIAALIMDKRYSNYRFNKVMNMLNFFFDYVVIDEFQDISTPELQVFVKLNKEFLSRKIQLILVGDIYQSCVESTGEGYHPYNLLNKYGEKDFIRKKLNFRKKHMDLDCSTLNKSYRISKNVGNFIRKKLQISIYGNDDKESDIYEIAEKEDVKHKVLNNKEIMILTDTKSEQEKLNNEYDVSYSRMMNIGISKGLEFPKIAILLTKKQSDYLKEKSNKLSTKSFNKLYVALTRSRSEVYLIYKEALR